MVERDSAKLWFAEFGAFCADAGRNDDEGVDESGCVVEHTDDEGDDKSFLLDVGFALGMQGKGWKKIKKLYK